MPNWVNNTITINGQIAIAAAMAGTQLLITRVAAGSGIPVIAPFTLTTLVTPQLNLIPTPPQVTANNLQPGEIIVMATLDSANVTSTFNLTEMGVFAKSGSGPEVMIAYCQASSPYDSISPGSGSSRLQINEQIPIIVGVGASVSITVQAGNPVFVPPVVAGPGIAVAAPTNAAGQVQQYIVSTPTLTVSATLQVAHGNNNVAPNFSNVQNALNYLAQYSIPSNVAMYINVAAGVYSGADAVFSCTHVNGSQITISGPNYGDQNFTSFGVVGGSAGQWQVMFTGLSGTTNFLVGGFAVVWDVGLTVWGNTLLHGSFLILAKTATTVTLYIPYGAALPISATNGWMVPIGVYMSTPVSQGCAYVGSHGLGLLQGIACAPAVAIPTNTTINAFNISGPTNVYHCGAWGYQNNTNLCGGFGIGAYCAMWRCGSTANNMGFISGGASSELVAAWCAASYNSQLGWWADGAAEIVPIYDFVPGAGDAYCWAAGNGQWGFYIADGSTLVMQAGYVGGGLYTGHAYIAYNGAGGCVLTNQSRGVASTVNSIINSAYNPNQTSPAIDFVVSALSVWNMPRGGTGTINHPVGTLTLDGCFYQ